MATTYTVDHDGINGRCRVWWIGPLGYSHAQQFDSHEAAERWADEMAAMEADDTARNATIQKRGLPVMNADRGKN